MTHGSSLPPLSTPTGRQRTHTAPQASLNYTSHACMCLRLLLALQRIAHALMTSGSCAPAQGFRIRALPDEGCLKPRWLWPRCVACMQPGRRSIVGPFLTRSALGCVLIPPIAEQLCIGTQNPLLTSRPISERPHCSVKGPPRPTAAAIPPFHDFHPLLSIR